MEQLRQIMGEIMVADIRAQVTLSLFTDFENFTEFKPASFHETTLHTMIDQLVSWGEALKTVRK